MSRNALVLSVTLALAAVVLWLTLTPIAMPPGPRQSDKVYHLVAFAGIVLPSALFQPRWLPRVAAAAIALGGFIEIVQPYVHRDRSLGDFVADALGALLVYALARLLRQRARVNG